MEYQLLSAVSTAHQRLPDTLRHICELEIPPDIPFELIIVDNNSTDDTTGTAEKLLKQFKFRHPSKILFQPEQGLSPSRRMGIENSQYEYVIFCDDDNWLSKDYVKIGADIMRKNPYAAAAGGFSEGLTDGIFPDWFNNFQENYAIGKQADRNGKITIAAESLWGAGMILRKSALHDLYVKGFRSLLTDRRRYDLSSGGDVELCYALKLAGWEIHYYSSLQIKHFIPEQRLNWKYLRKLNRGFGAQKVNLDAYLIALNPDAEILARTWQSELKKFLRKLRGYGFKKLLTFNKLNEGDAEILRIEKTIGRIAELTKIRANYDRGIKLVMKAAWRKDTSADNIKL